MLPAFAVCAVPVVVLLPVDVDVSAVRFVPDTLTASFTTAPDHTFCKVTVALRVFVTVQVTFAFGMVMVPAWLLAPAVGVKVTAVVVPVCTQLTVVV